MVIPVPDHGIHTYFRVDRDDRICELGGAWDEFAEANDGQAALAKFVLGTSIFDHISGDISRMYVRTVFEGVRALRRPATRAYRCDSPRVKRFMEMTVAHEPAGGLRVAHRLLRTEALMPPMHFLHGENRITVNPLVRCSMCNRLKHKGDWSEPDTVLKADHSALEHAIHVIYGVCSACMDGVRALRST